MAKKKPKIHAAELLPLAMLYQHPRNPQKQDKHTFNELRESIRKNGFDESLIVVPRTDDELGYWIISGNHRAMAAKAEGLVEVPCVVRNDWDAVQAEVEVIRRNYVRGEMDRGAFTELVNYLAEEHDIEMSLIMEMMGFQDMEDFAALYASATQAETDTIKEVTQKSQEVAMIDNLSMILSSIFEKYGSTVPNSFLVFPMSGKKHMYVEITPALKNTLEVIATQCVKEGTNINITLGGLLSIGIKNSNFLESVSEEVIAEGSVEGNADLTWEP